MRTRLFIAVLACSALTACQGIKDALTAHTDVVARTVSQQLSVTRLATLFAKAKIPVEPTKENAGILADIWVDYQRIGYAGAHSDSLTDKIESAMLPLLNSERVMMYQDSMRKTLKVDSATEAGYNAGKDDIYSARHILVKFPDSTGSVGCSQPIPCPTAKQKDSTRKVAAALLPQVTAASFAEIAKKRSGDPGSAAQGGDLPPFFKPEMVPEFSAGTAALKPGEISKVIESAFGEHIIQRRTYAEVKDQYNKAYNDRVLRGADSVWREGLAKDNDVKVKAGAGAVAKEAVKNESQHHKDNATLATFKGGTMTVSRFLDWLQSIPPNYNIKQQLVQAPDSLVDTFLKGMALQEVFLKKADAAKIDVPATEKTQYRLQFSQLIAQVQDQLGVSPKLLSDSAKTTSEKEALAAKRVDALMDRIMAGEGQPPTIPPPIKAVLDAKYDASVSPAGLDRVVQEATKARASADSARASTYPPSQVPIPGAGGAPPGTPAPPAPPATKKPPK